MTDKPPFAEFGAHLQRWMITAGVSLRDIERSLGISYTAVHNWKNGKNLPKRQYVRPLSEILDVSEAEIHKVISGHPQPPLILNDEDDSAAQSTSKPYEANILDLDRLGQRNVPVLGVAVGGEDADFYFDGDPVAYVRRPEAIANLADVYALYVVGDSMSPRFKDGELVYVHRRTPSIGDDVVVQLHPIHPETQPRGFIKHLVKRTASEWICEQYNPAQPVHFERQEVLRVDRVLKLHELLGV